MPVATQVSVSLPEQQFHGPIQLLVEIVSQGEIDLADLSVSEVVTAYLDALEGLPLEQLTDFIAVAASLILLKSRGLLPDDSPEELLEDLYRWEEKDLLVARLIECRTFRHASQHMQSRMELAAKSVPRRVELEERYWNLYPDPLVEVSLADLLDAYLRSTVKEPTPMVEVSHLSPIKFKVVDAVGHLSQEIPAQGEILFRDIPRQYPGRTGFVVYFLAVLELWRQGFLELSQVRTFGDIKIAWLGVEAQLDHFDSYGEETAAETPELDSSSAADAGVTINSPQEQPNNPKGNP